MKKILIIIIAVIVIAGGVGAYFLFFNKPKEEAEPKVELYTYAIEDAFITNVKGSQKLFKTSVILVVNKENMDEVFAENTYIIRDTIIMILRELTEEEISGMTIQDMLRTEIASALNKALEIDNIVSVYFGDFVMQ